jgi:hypothetical protein
MRAIGEMDRDTGRKFYPARNDALFLRLFSDVGSEGILAGLLGAVLEIEGLCGEQVVIVDPRVKGTRDEKLSILDVRVKLDDGTNKKCPAAPTAIS